MFLTSEYENCNIWFKINHYFFIFDLFFDQIYFLNEAKTHLKQLVSLCLCALYIENVISSLLRMDNLGHCHWGESVAFEDLSTLRRCWMWGKVLYGTSELPSILTKQIFNYSPFIFFFNSCNLYLAELHLARHLGTSSLQNWWSLPHSWARQPKGILPH